MKLNVRHNFGGCNRGPGLATPKKIYEPIREEPAKVLERKSIMDTIDENRIYIEKAKQTAKELKNIGKFDIEEMEKSQKSLYSGTLSIPKESKLISEKYSRDLESYNSSEKLSFLNQDLAKPKKKLKH